MLENVNDLLKQLSDSENNTVIREFEIDDVIFEQNISYDKELERIRIYSWDITKIREMSQYMAYQANHDPLTGLVNRREFEKQLENAIASAVKENKHHVICYMDLDQFKVVNDTCGHIAGDALLQQLSATLQTHIRDSDLLARLGGDEFGLLLSGCETEFAENIAEKIRQLIQDFRFHWEEKTFRVGVSIGLVPIDAQSISVSDILSVADSACYLAKDHGRNQVYTYKPSDRVLVKHTDEMNWTHRVHEALENSRFILYSQQVVPVTNNKPGYQEILVRMIDSNDNIIPPTAFLPSAERYGQITDIDIWVITNALEHFSTVDQESCFALNLSGKTLGNSRSMRQIIDEINNCGIDPERICFEITETAMIANLNAAIRFVSTLRGQGCRIALDDFGSGLSSFAYLKNLPVDYLKIDGNFIRNMDSDPVNAAMVESIIQVGHKMNLEIIAEYVENKYILEHLKNMGINYVQGYAIAKPEPLSEITREPKSNTIV